MTIQMGRPPRPLRCRASLRRRSKLRAPSRQQRWPIKAAEADQEETRRREPAVLIARIERNNEARSDSTGMKYRDIEYTVVKGLGRRLWKWGFELETKVVTGQAATRAEAVAKAERAIDLALALVPKKLRLVPPPSE